MTRDIQTIWPFFDELYEDIDTSAAFPNNRPLLAHYSTVVVLEQMAINNEIWFSNPLLMNDHEELRFGINEGTRAFLSDQDIRNAFSTSADALLFEQSLLQAHQYFEQNHAFDTYVLCFSQHERDDVNGLLSMWRGYGDSGKGVAVVFDPSHLEETASSPLIVAKVEYASTEKRFQWFSGKAAQFARIVAQRRLSGDEVTLAAQALFARLRLFSLFTKHQGFDEEREWRIAYLPERDQDQELTQYFSYHNGPNGVHPKLKIPFTINSAWSNQGITLERLVHSIILGPTSASPLAVLSTQRMLKSINRAQLAERVVASTIPYRG